MQPTGGPFSAQRVCPQCGKPVQPGDTHCMECGQFLPPPPRPRPRPPDPAPSPPTAPAQQAAPAPPPAAAAPGPRSGPWAAHAAEIVQHYLRAEENLRAAGAFCLCVGIVFLAAGAVLCLVPTGPQPMWLAGAALATGVVGLIVAPLAYEAARRNRWARLMLELTISMADNLEALRRGLGRG